MNITLLHSASGYQVYLHLALRDAVADYAKAWDALRDQPPLTESTATVELTLLHYHLEQRRAVVLLLTASCVEAVANFCLACKATPDQFTVLERATFLEKWTTVPSLFLPGYSLPRDGELFQDLKRVHDRRNALMHLKENVSIAGVTTSLKSTPARAGDEHIFIPRCGTLPDRLFSHLCTFDTSGAFDPVIGIFALADAISTVTQKQAATPVASGPESSLSAAHGAQDRPPNPGVRAGS